MLCPRMVSTHLNGLFCQVSEAVDTCHLGFTGTPHNAEGRSMASSLQITGTPAEIYEQHMVPAIFVRWAPDLVEAAGTQIAFRPYMMSLTVPEKRQEAADPPRPPS